MSTVLVGEFLPDGRVDLHDGNRLVADPQRGHHLGLQRSRRASTALQIMRVVVRRHVPALLMSAP
ncbi:hypothetical protein AB0N14_02080 [Streptomyces sp. NPDC051104]|uniref:hypothetical protein n=1 Tax=Streptomyces sp. NPDC051104 TaxID=3155044 RepID=UPI003421E239